MADERCRLGWPRRSGRPCRGGTKDRAHDHSRRHHPVCAVRFLLIVMATIFGTFVGMYVMQAAIEPVSKVTAISGVRVRR